MVNAGSAPAVLAVENMLFRWPGAAAPCLDLPAFHVARGARVFLHGPSGSGKSTLLSVLGGVLAPQQGAVRLLGADLAALSPGMRDRLRSDHVGFIFQQFNLIPYLSVLDNVLLPCRFSARRRARAAAAGGSARAEACRLLARLALEPALYRRQAITLSVGQQQRVAAARALIGRPELVIADEPTSALDAALQRDFLALLMDECAAAEASLLLVSHDHRMAPHFTYVAALPELNRAHAAAQQR